MLLLKSIAVVLLGIAVTGCTTSTGQVYHGVDWKPGQALGKVLVIVPEFRSTHDAARPEHDEKIRTAIRASLEQLPATSVIDIITENAANSPISESRALALGAQHGAQSVCIVIIGQFGGLYLVTALPPGWDSRTTVQYAMRVLDVKSGTVLVDCVRQRTSGGYLAIKTATYPADLTADLNWVLAAAP